MAEFLDQWTTEKDGIKVRIDILTDDDADPSEFDCYSEAATAAFRNGEWRFVGMVVTPLIDGLDPGEGFAHSAVSADTWALEWGALPVHLGSPTHVGRDELMADCFADLFSEAKKKLREVRYKLNALNLND